MRRHPERFGPWPEAAGWLAVAAVQVAVLWLERLGPPRRPLGDEALYRGAAEQLLATGTTDLSPLWPPLQIVVLAALKAVGGWWLVPWVQWGLLLLSAWLLYRLARRVLGDVPEARWAPMLLLAYPPLVAFSQFYWPEVLHLALMLGLVELLLSAAGSARRLWAAGVLAGLAVATKALLMPWLPIFFLAAGSVVGPTENRPWSRPRLRPMAWFGLGLAVTILPVMAWNAQRVGVFTLSSSAAFNLWVGLEETSNQSLVDGIVGDEYRAFLASGETFQERQGVLWGKIRRKIDRQGLVAVLGDQIPKQYLRLFDKETFFTDQLPGGVIFERGHGYRQRPAWLTEGLRGLSYGLYALLLVAGCLGWVVSEPRRNPWLRGVALFVLFNLGLFLLLHVKSRFRIQLLPWMALYAAMGWVWLRQVMGEQEADQPRWRDVPRWRCWVGGLGALLALGLAFGPY